MSLGFEDGREGHKRMQRSDRFRGMLGTAKFSADSYTESRPQVCPWVHAIAAILLAGLGPAAVSPATKNRMNKYFFFIGILRFETIRQQDTLASSERSRQLRRPTIGWFTPLQAEAGDDLDWDSLTVQGTCSTVEKRYLRLTSVRAPIGLQSRHSFPGFDYKHSVVPRHPTRLPCGRRTCSSKPWRW